MRNKHFSAEPGASPERIVAFEALNRMRWANEDRDEAELAWRWAVGPAKVAAHARYQQLQNRVEVALEDAFNAMAKAGMA